jgi:hypothetical protein
VATTIPGNWEEVARLQVEVVPQTMQPRGSGPVAPFSLPRAQLQQELGPWANHYLQAMTVVGWGGGLESSLGRPD